MRDSVRNEEEIVDDVVEEEMSDVTEEGTAVEDGAEASAEMDADVAETSEAGAPGRDELQSVQREMADLNDRHLRLVAEFNNFRRRTEQERLGAWARAQADLVAKFLDVLDDLNRVAELDLGNATVETIMEGIDLVERKFVRVLEESGVEVIDPAGEIFDPERMEAMLRVPAESEDQDEEVAQVFQKGYSLKGLLVRPARVSVYKSE
jgi:molecular chaperone GrpE